MLAIGLISLFSLGLVGLIAHDDGDDGADVDETSPQQPQDDLMSPADLLNTADVLDDEDLLDNIVGFQNDAPASEDETPQQDDPPQQDAPDDSAPEEPTAPEDPTAPTGNGQGAGPIYTGEDEYPIYTGEDEEGEAPALPTVDATTEETAINTPDAVTTDDVARPPTGDGYNDPRINAEAADAQRLAEELAAAEAREPTNLVTVTGAFDSEVSDELVLSEAPESADTTDADYIVTAPDSLNNISVGYDAEHTFQIDYSAQTETISASLNSHIQGPEGSDVPVITQETDENGVAFTQTALTKSYEGSTEINIDVAQDHVGGHIAQIDLSNPDDSVHFEFAEDVTGNYHLVYNEVDQGDEGDTNAVRSLYVIETLSFVQEITDEHVVTAMEQGVGATGVGIIIAEIFLGEDALEVSGDPETGEGYEMQISNFINQNPQITSNVEWTSISEREDLVAEVPLTAEQTGPRAPDSAASGGATSTTGGTSSGSSGGSPTTTSGLNSLFGNLF
jgi:hypothetical protein